MAERGSLLGGARRKRQQREAAQAEQQWLRETRPPAEAGHEHSEPTEAPPVQHDRTTDSGELSQQLEALRFNPSGWTAEEAAPAAEEAADGQPAAQRATSAAPAAEAQPLSPEENHSGLRRRGGRVRTDPARRLARIGWLVLLVVLVLTIVIAGL